MTSSFAPKSCCLPSRALASCAAFALVICTALFPSGVANAQANDGASREIEFIKPFLSETTLLVIKVDPSRLEGPTQVDAPEGSAEITSLIKKLLDRAQNDAGFVAMRAAAGDQTLYATVGIPISKTRAQIGAFRKRTTDEDAKRFSDFVERQLGAKAYVEGGYLVAIPVDSERITPSSTEASRTAIAAGLDAVKDHPMSVVFTPPSHVWRTIEELSPRLPTQLGGGPSSVLTEGVKWAALGFDPQALKLDVVIQSSSESAAEKFAAHLPTLLHSAHQAAPATHKQIPPELAKLLVNWLKPTVEGSQVRIRVEGFQKTKANLALLGFFASLVEDQARRQSNMNRFKQIMLGLHNYYDVYKSFAPADKHRDDEGKQRLSWRVHILPFVEQQELYSQFRLDEAWDSPHNIKLLPKMPDIYATHGFGPTKIKPGHTTFLAPVGDKTVFGGEKSARFSDITDGTSNTVVVVEVSPKLAKPWTAPDDFQFNAKDPLKGVHFDPDGNWLGAMGDGSVRRFSKNVSSENVLHLFQMNDGHLIKLD